MEETDALQQNTENRVLENPYATSPLEKKRILNNPYATPIQVIGMEEDKSILEYIRDEQEAQAMRSRIKNAEILSKTLNIPVEYAYQNETEIRKNLYPGVDESSGNFANKLKIVWDFNSKQEQINQLRWQQINGYDNGKISEEIKKIRVSMPEKNEVDRITEFLMSNESMGNKIIELAKSFPYVAVSQGPRMLEGAKLGVPIAIGGAVAGGIVASGPGALVGAKYGFYAGQTMATFRSTTGGIIDSVMTEAEMNGISIDPKKYAAVAYAGGFASALIDTMSLNFGLTKSVAGKTLKEVMEDVAKVNTQTAIKDQVKLTAIATAKKAGGWLEPGLVEGFTETIQGMTENYSSEVIKALHNIDVENLEKFLDKKAVDPIDVAISGKFSKKPMKDILADSLLEGAMAIPMAVVSAGLLDVGSNIVRKNAVNSSRINEAKINEEVKNINKEQSTENVTDKKVKKETEPVVVQGENLTVKSKIFKKMDTALKNGDFKNLNNYIDHVEKTLDLYEKPKGGLSVFYKTFSLITEGQDKTYVMSEHNIGDEKIIIGKHRNGDKAFEVRQYVNGENEITFEDNITGYEAYKITNKINDSTMEGNLPSNWKEYFSHEELQTVYKAFGSDPILFDRKVKTPVSKKDKKKGQAMTISTVKEFSEMAVANQSNIVKMQLIKTFYYNLKSRIATSQDLLASSGNLAEAINAIIKDDDIPINLRNFLSEKLVEFGTRPDLSDSNLARLKSLKENKATSGAFDPSSTEDLLLLGTDENTYNLENIDPRILNDILVKFSEKKDLANFVTNINGKRVSQLKSKILAELNVNAKKSVGDDVSQISAVKRFFNATKGVFIVNQRQYHNLVEMIGGEHSLFSKVFYHSLRDKEIAIKSQTQKFHDDIKNEFLKSVDQKEIDSMNSVKIKIPGFNFPAISFWQGVSILMHMDSKKNRNQIKEHGMRYKDFMGRTIDFKGEDFFEAVKKEVSQYPVAQAYVRAFRNVSTELLHMQNATKIKLDGVPLTSEFNWFPMKNAEETFVDTDFKTLDKDTKGKNYLSVRHGSLIGRNDELVAGPLMLDDALNTMFNVVHNGTAFAIMEPTFWTISKLLEDKEIQNSIENRHSAEHYNVLKRAIEYQAGITIKNNSMEQAISVFRTNMTAAITKGNIFMALKAPISIIYGLQHLSPTNMLDAVNRIMFNPKESKEYVARVSPLIKDRILNGGGESLQEVMRKMSGQRTLKNNKAISIIGDYGLIRSLDINTCIAIFLAGEKEGMDIIESGKLTDKFRQFTGVDSITSRMTASEKSGLARVYAEEIVRRTQPAQSNLNQHNYYRSGELMKTMSTFGSFVNISHNMVDVCFHQIKKYGPSAVPGALFTLSLIAMSSAAAFGVDVLKDKILERETKKRFGDVMASAFLSNTFILRDVYGMWYGKKAYGAFAGGKASPVPMVAVGQDFVTSAVYLTTCFNEDGSIDKRKASMGINYFLDGSLKASGLPISAKQGYEAIINRLE